MNDSRRNPSLKLRLFAISHFIISIGTIILWNNLPCHSFNLNYNNNINKKVPKSPHPSNKFKSWKKLENQISYQQHINSWKFSNSIEQDDHRKDSGFQLRSFIMDESSSASTEENNYSTTQEDEAVSTNIPTPTMHLSAKAASGLHDSEIEVILSTIAEACKDFGVNWTQKHNPIRVDSLTFQEKCTFHGVTGRVLLLGLDGVGSDWTDDDERLDPFYGFVFSSIDRLNLNQPVLVTIRPNCDDKCATTFPSLFIDIVRAEIEKFELCKPLSTNNSKHLSKETHGMKQARSYNYNPTKHIEIDGANIIDPQTGEEKWDTSCILVYDNVVDDNLRQRLLEVVNGKGNDTKSEEWNDIQNGPDPSRWVRGGLDDIPGSEVYGKEVDGDTKSSSWGLPMEAVNDLCYNQHAAISEFESILVDLFSDFTVTRLSEAVLGATVSPLTANAPTHGDSFEYHIDADPNLAPPSPWSDVFGRYPNRIDGKPRFVSCLLYLNESWEENWGAHTRFRDPPTGQTVDIIPKPGRCVVMDQDVTHTVTAPNSNAGKRPRYSLVWKLVLHPKVKGQNMQFLGTEGNAGYDTNISDMVYFCGSANRMGESYFSNLDGRFSF